MIGTRLGPYEILAKVGEGGMGTVYRAHDSRLGRDVAIKVSAEQFSERFEREARAIAALNHTNICHLYDVGPNYLVMEIVEGQTLAGPLPLNEALPLIRQLIDGIEAAHDKAIVHRDLKPANIKVTPDGVVKILDFGLAKAADPDEPVDTANSPTMTFGATKAGVIVGTAAYMSPEQARGKPADRRSDIFSFGAVVYELLAGGPAFTGESVADLLSAVLNKEPDWSKVPASIRGLLQWCMEKERRQRLQAIGDARRWLDAGGTAAPAETRNSTRQMWLTRGVAAALGVALVAALVFLAPAHFRKERPPEVTTFRVLGDGLGEPTGLGQALSPDGRTLAMTWNGLDGSTPLAIRDLDNATTRLLAGVAGAETPFFSADGRELGYFSSLLGSLMRVPVSGGTPSIVAQLSGNRRGAAWLPSGRIVFAESGRLGLYSVPASGGPEDVVVGPTAFGERYPSFPTATADGQTLVFQLGPYPTQLAAWSTSTARSAILGAGSFPKLVSDNRLFFARENELWTAEFDREALQMRNATRVNVDVLTNTGGLSNFAVAGDTLAVVAPALGLRHVVEYDRQGRRQVLTDRPLPVTGNNSTAISSDGRFVAMVVNEEGGRLVTFDLERRVSSRASPRAIASSSEWSPDGDLLFYDIGSSSLRRLKPGSDSEPTTVLTRVASASVAVAPKGQVIFLHQDDGGARSIYLADPNAPSRAARLRTPRAGGVQSLRLSPDGRWIAYSEFEGGQLDVYMRPLQSPDQRVQVTNGGGEIIGWGANGREILYFGDGAVWSVAVNTGRVPSVGEPHRLFRLDGDISAVGSIGVMLRSMADGNRFIALERQRDLIGRHMLVMRHGLPQLLAGKR